MLRDILFLGASENYVGTSLTDNLPLKIFWKRFNAAVSYARNVEKRCVWMTKQLSMRSSGFSLALN